MTETSEVSVSDLNNLAGEIAELRSQEALASQGKKKITEALETAETKMIELLTGAGLTKFDSAFGKVVISHRLSVKTPKTPEDREAFYNRLKEQGLYEAMISVNSQTLNSYYKEEFEKAKERGDDDFEIPGIREVTMNPILSFKRS